MKFICLTFILSTCFLFSLCDEEVTAQTRDSLWAADSIRTRPGISPDTLVETTIPKFPLWFMGCFSLDVVSQNVGNDLNLIGYSFQSGLTWHDQLLLFVSHGIRGYYSTDPVEEYRYDYALLYGISKRNEFSFLNAGVGVSKVDYSKHGGLLTPVSSPNGSNANYSLEKGTSWGVAALAQVYYTPIAYWGLFGTGLYASISKNESYFALEFSMVELNIPIPFLK